jgi:histidinol-phosphate aminotransferase
MVRVRAPLSQLPAYVPGRKPPGAVVLASNESPYGLLPGVAGTLAEAASGLSRYPDLHAGPLVEALAAHLGVEPDRIAVGAGSSEVCGQVLHTVVGPGDAVVFGWRSFEAYPILTAVASGTAGCPCASTHSTSTPWRLRSERVAGWYPGRSAAMGVLGSSP